MPSDKLRDGLQTFLLCRDIHLIHQDICTKRFTHSFFQNFCRAKLSDDHRYRVDSARELVLIHDELLIVRRFTVDNEDISFMLHELLRY